MNLKQWLLYMTNNEEESRHEPEFDVAFFIINTVAVFLGCVYFVYINQLEWLPFLVIEYIWALDAIRHNRP